MLIIIGAAEVGEHGGYVLGGAQDGVIAARHGEVCMEVCLYL